MALTMSRLLASGCAALLVFSSVVGARAAAVLVEKHENLLHQRNVGQGTNFSPFFTHHTDGTPFLPSDGWFPVDVTQAADPATAESTTPKKSFSFVGDSTAAGNWTDGNGIPAGITLTFDAEFTVSAVQSPAGLMLTTAGPSTANSSGRGIGLTVVQGGHDDIETPRALEFSPVTVSNVNFTGTLADTNFSFTPGTVSNFGAQLFESGQFNEDSEGFILEHATGTIGFGTAEGSGTTAEYSNLLIKLNFGIYADPPVTDPLIASGHFPRQNGPFTMAASEGESLFRGVTLGYDVTYDISPVGAVEDADFDGDGDVDGDDFLTWQRGLGVGNDLSTGDANDDNVVDGDDLAIWTAQFGPGASLAAVAQIPEPASAALLAVGGIAMIGARRRRS
jgi:hypothetical protein